MRDSTKNALVLTSRIVIVVACVAVVVIARTVVGWGSVLLMLAALGVLLVVLATYNRRYR